MDAKCIQIIKKLSRIDVWHRKIQENDDYFNSRNDFINVLDYCDYSTIYNFISKFSLMIPDRLNY